MIDVAGTLHRGWHGADRPDRLPAAADHRWRSWRVGLATVYSRHLRRQQSRCCRQVAQHGRRPGRRCGSVAQLPPQKLMRFAVPLYVVGRAFCWLPSSLFGIKVRAPSAGSPLGFTRIQPSRDHEDRHAADAGLVFPEVRGQLRAAPLRWSPLLLVVPVRPDRQAARPRHGDRWSVAAGFYVIFFAGLPWKVIVGLVARRRPRAAPLALDACCTTTSASAS